MKKTFRMLIVYHIVLVFFFCVVGSLSNPAASLPVAGIADHQTTAPASLAESDWRLALRERLSRLTASPEVNRAQGGELSVDWRLQRAGDLGLAIRMETNGVQIESLYDLRQHRELLASNQPPLFTLKMRGVPGKKEIELTADAGWRKTAYRSTSTGFRLLWEYPTNSALFGLKVIATGRGDVLHQAWLWRFEVENHLKDWSVWRVSFPRIALANLGTNASVLFPRGPGEAQTNVWNRAFTYRGTYPSGWCSMQFMAAYQDPFSLPESLGASRPNGAIDLPVNGFQRLPVPATGIYFAVHDPWGSVKDIGLSSKPESQSVLMYFDHPAPDMGVAGNSFQLSGEAIWQLLRGDWFTAASIYKDWVRQKARWWPTLSNTGRSDTPTWMRELNAWAMAGGAPDSCVDRVKQFQKTLGVPVGFHWYNWHQIPFDNDYPHYFPAKAGFAEGVKTLQDAQVFVMPYINGRLWDTHDRGDEDFEFSQKALAAATKNEEGKPYVETYGSKETNGTPVRLAVMCPTTRLWRQTIQDIVRQLLKEVGTRAVYIDQVAAASPALCLDATHGHPLGGGHWWNEGYWQMLGQIRRAMPRNCMLTTECNGEPFIRVFDGYLTWHWQYDGQVPAFPAIYGGTIQMFGRAYRSGPTKDPALCMKAGQQLVFGEQIGWLDPKDLAGRSLDFFRQVVRARDRFRDYFSRGEMARPPQLTGPLPKVKADWQWSGEWWVATDAVLTGAWEIPKNTRLVLLFVNVSDARITTSLRFQPGDYGIPVKQIQCAQYQDDGPRTASISRSSQFEQALEFQPFQVQAWELFW